jgi:hypothetical protein
VKTNAPTAQVQDLTEQHLDTIAHACRPHARDIAGWAGFDNRPGQARRWEQGSNGGFGQRRWSCAACGRRVRGTRHYRNETARRRETVSVLPAGEA